MIATESRDDSNLIFQADDKNLLSVLCLDSVFAVGRLAQWLARLVYTE